MVGPRAISANRLASAVGVSQETLSRWLRDAHGVEGIIYSKRVPKWTGAQSLRVAPDIMGRQSPGAIECPCWMRRP